MPGTRRCRGAATTRGGPGWNRYYGTILATGFRYGSEQWPWGLNRFCGPANKSCQKTQRYRRFNLGSRASEIFSTALGGSHVVDRFTTPVGRRLRGGGSNSSPVPKKR